MIRIDWDPVLRIGPIPIRWYGVGWLAAFLAARALLFRRRPAWLPADALERLLLWTLAGAFVGARFYFVAQNEPWFYFTHPWEILAVWNGGLAFFGGLFGAIGASYVCVRHEQLRFGRVADLFAPVVPIAAAIGRLPCFLDGMDYGTPTTLSWGVVYVNPASFAPLDGIARHPDQLYELAGDLAIAVLVSRARAAPQAGLRFLLYLVLFSVLRFFLFFVRGNVPAIGLGLKNAQWTALAIFIVALPWLLALRRDRRHRHATR